MLFRSTMSTQQNLSGWRCLAGIIASTVVTVLILPTVAIAQSYPLTCKSGITMRLFVGIANGLNTATIFFKPSPQSAAAGVAPGFCAWSDRGWRNGEPASLLIRDAGRVVGSFQNGRYSELGFTRGDIRGLESITRNSGQIFIFQVHREGSAVNGGTMVVDRIGP